MEIPWTYWKWGLIILGTFFVVPVFLMLIKMVAKYWTSGRLEAVEEHKWDFKDKEDQ